MAALIVFGDLQFACAQFDPTHSDQRNEADSSIGANANGPSANESAVASLFDPKTWEPTPGITVRLRGRLDTDAIWSHQSPANEATFGDLSDVVGLRRARIGAEGELGSFGRYVAEIDLASGNVVPRDVYIASGDLQDLGESQLGHFREPFSLEGGTSAKYFAFMERSPINSLDPARNWGVGLFRENLDQNSALGIGAFYSGTSPSDFQGGDGSTIGITGRLTTALINDGDGERLLHLGIALSERVPANGVIIINQKARSPLLDLGDSSESPFVPMIRIPASFQQLINLQFAAANGPMWAQAEWYGSLIDQTGGGPVFFHGCHADWGYFLTGEHRRYDASNGTLGSIRVIRPSCCNRIAQDRPRGWGAWEVTARFSYLDFVDSDTPLSPNGQLSGIRLAQTTFGLNWYPTDNIRLMLNYSYAVPEEPNTGTSAANVLGTRLAVFW
jgi:phosphate-selective porin OprO/OprP